MARDFYDEDWEVGNDRDWEREPAHLWDDLTLGTGWDDDFGKMLFDMAFVDPETADIRASAYDMLREWMADEYHVDFDAEFDWQAWREWYG